MARYDPKERIGVNVVERIFLEDFLWIPRTIYQSDIGIDLAVELVNEGNPLGNFINVQIKYGEHYFKEDDENDIVFRTDDAHVQYWINSSIPVLIVLHDPQTQETLWQFVNESTCVSTGKGWKILIPKTNVLKKEFKPQFESLFAKPAPTRKFERLLLDKPIIDKIESGKKVVVDFARDLVNYTATCTLIEVTKEYEEDDVDDHEREDLFFSWTEGDILTVYHLSQVQSHQVLFTFFPWADFKVDMHFYEHFNEYPDYQTPGYKLVFTEDLFRDYKLPIVPYYRDESVAKYRLGLTINKFGKTFLDFSSYLIGPKQLELDFK